MRLGVRTAIATVVLGIVGVAVAYGSWAFVDLEELVLDSSLIVEGVLENVIEFRQGDMDYGIGDLFVREVLWGEGKGPEVLRLKWSNRHRVFCPRVEHREHAGKVGVWLLNAAGEDPGQGVPLRIDVQSRLRLPIQKYSGCVRADYPGRFRRANEKREVLDLLRKRTCFLRGRYAHIAPQGVPVSVPLEFVVRNGSCESASMLLPTASASGISLPEGWTVTLLENSFPDGEMVVRTIAPRAGSVVAAVGTPTVIAGRGERSVQFDLASCFVLRAGPLYKVVLTCPGADNARCQALVVVVKASDQ